MARLAPRPERGPQLAAAAVLLAVLGALLTARFEEEWSAGARFVVLAVLLAPVAAMAFSVVREERPYVSTLQVATFVLAAFALGNLADALGADTPFGSAGTLVWIGLALIALCVALRRRAAPAILTLLIAATAVVVALSFVRWAFDAHSAQTARWVLLLCALALAAGVAWLRDRRRREGVALADVAGLAILGLAATIVAPFIGDGGGGTGWELVLLVFGCALLAYGAVDRERVPAFIGVLLLAAFVIVAGPASEDGPSLVGWPLVLVVLAGGLLATGLRPAVPAPPEPAVPDAQPTAPTEIVE